MVSDCAAETDAGGVIGAPVWAEFRQHLGGSGLKFLKLCRSNRFEDVSLNQWLALTPAQLVKSHLGLDQSTIDGLDKAKKITV